MSRSGGSSSNGRAAQSGGDCRSECGFCAFGAQYCRSVTRSDGDVGLLRLGDLSGCPSQRLSRCWALRDQLWTWRDELLKSALD